MKIHLLAVASLALTTTLNSSGAITIDLTYVATPADNTVQTGPSTGGINGSGITQEMTPLFDRAIATYQQHLTGYRAGITGPASISLTASAPTIDGPGGGLAFARPLQTTVSNGYTLTVTGEFYMDIADLVGADPEFAYETIFHEIGHALGIGSLWEENGLYVYGSGQYTGAKALENYQRDFDPNATFVPVEIGQGPGTDDSHWDEGSGAVANNPNAPYDGNSLDDEILSGTAAQAGEFLSDLTLGSFYDLGFEVNFLVAPGPYHWDAGNTTADGAITSADGVWDLTNTNFARPDGTENLSYSDPFSVLFGDQAAQVTLAGVFSPTSMSITADGYTFIGGGLDTGNGLKFTVVDAAHTANLNSPVTGTGPITFDGAGTVNNLNSIATQVLLNSGTLVNNGAGTITGNTTIASGASLQTDAGGLGAGIEMTNNGDLQIAADQTIKSYAGGGKLSGAGKLTADSFALTNGASIESDLLKGDITTSGTVAIAGTSVGDLAVQSGVTTLTGSNSGANINISAGAELRASSNTLNDNAAVSNAGTLNLQGDETVATYDGSGGTLKGAGKLSVNSFKGGKVETAIAGSKTLGLSVDANGGAVTLGAGSSLKFDTAGQSVGALDVFNLFTNHSGVVGDATSSGFANFDTSALGDGVKAVFDVSSGNIIITSGSASGSTPNESAIATALLGGQSNAARMSNVGGIQAGASSDVINRLFALANASTTDTVTVQTQLQELSPEVYTSVADYSLRQHLSYTETVRYAPYMVRSGKFQVFAGANSQRIETNSSLDAADYKLQGNGGYFGIATQLGTGFRFGLYGAHDSGDITSDRLKLESKGSVVGAFAEFDVLMPWENDQKRGVITAGFSVGSFDFNGTRIAQGLVNNADNIQSNTLEIGLGYKVALIENPYFKFNPYISANHITAEVEAFVETGANNSLSVSEHEKTLMLLNYGLEAEWKPTANAFGLTAKLGFQNNFGDDQAEFKSAFSGGNNFDIVAPGLSDSTTEGRIGMFYNFSNTARVGASYFMLSGNDIETANGGNVGFSLQW